MKKYMMLAIVALALCWATMWEIERQRKRKAIVREFVEFNVNTDNIDGHAKPTPPTAADKKRECDPAHESAGSFNGVPYLCTAEGKLVIDKDLVQISKRLDKKHDDLYWALRTRVLTDDEMEQVRMVGRSLLMHGGETYSVSELEREFNGALLLQFQMRLVAEEHKRVPKNPMSGVPCVLGSLCNKTPSYMELPHGGHVDPGKERIR